MKVSNIIIKNYKSIGNACTLDLNKKSTVLVGKSNVGKSNILKAIEFAFNDEILSENEICSWKTIGYGDNCITIEFQLEEKDLEHLKKIDEDLKIKKKLVYMKKANGNKEIFFSPPTKYTTVFEPSEKISKNLQNFRFRTRKVLRKWRRVSQVSEEELDKINVLDVSVNKEKILNIKNSKEEQSQKLEEFVKMIKGIRAYLNDKHYRDALYFGIKASLSNIIRDVESFIPKIEFIEKKEYKWKTDDIYSLLPRFIYIESDDEISINDSIIVDEIKTADEENFMKKIIDVSSINVDVIEKSDGRKITTEVVKANKKLNDVFSRYWNQEKIKIELNYRTDTTQSTPINKIELDFIGEEGHRGNILDQSPGFRWFFAFVTKYLINNTTKQDIFLVLDEPAIKLHASAQMDILERFENTGSNIQILYTTHSPYLIDKNYPHRIRSVEKGDQNGNKRGTFINPKPYHSQTGRAWEPIRSAIGIPIGSSLFVAGNNLIVEGISDQIILSSIIQSMKQNNEQLKYDLKKVCICFAGKASNIIALALFCHQETFGAKVLVDSDKFEEIKKKLKNTGFPEENIFKIPEQIGKRKVIDIEGMFDPNFYHECFIEAYKRIFKNQIPKKFPDNWTNVEEFIQNEFDASKWGHSKYYDEYFSKNEGLGDFDKVIVASVIGEKLLDDGIAKSIYIPFNRLLEDIWKTKPIWF